jgi:hypothetical protein
MSEREQCWVINNEVVEPPPPLAISREELRNATTISSISSKPRAFWSAPGPSLTTAGSASAPA